MSDTYRRALDAAVREYEQALAERAALEARLGQLQQTIGTLSKLCGFAPTVPWGLTDACRTILRNAGAPLSAIDVRARLSSIGFDLGRYANDLAAIHTVLKRLAAVGEIAPARDRQSARTAYQVRGTTAATAASPRTARKRRHVPQR